MNRTEAYEAACDVHARRSPVLAQADVSKKSKKKLEHTRRLLDLWVIGRSWNEWNEHVELVVVFELSSRSCSSSLKRGGYGAGIGGSRKRRKQISPLFFTARRSSFIMISRDLT